MSTPTTKAIDAIEEALLYGKQARPRSPLFDNALRELEALRSASQPTEVQPVSDRRIEVIVELAQVDFRVKNGPGIEPNAVTLAENALRYALDYGYLFAHPPRPDVARLVDLPPAHKEYLESIGYDTVKAFSKAIGVKYMMVGELKVKDTSALIYKGLVLPVLGYYMKWPVQGSVGDGWDEYRVSLIGKGFEYQETNIATGDIEWIKAERWGHAAKATIPAVAPKDE